MEDFKRDVIDEASYWVANAQRLLDEQGRMAEVLRVTEEEWLSMMRNADERSEE